MSLFVSYSHKQSDWVHSCLIPVLRAAGAEVLVDIDHFKAGQTVIGQMDKLQSSASRHVLVITADYVASAYCRHEMDQAIKCDPGFVDGKVLPILQDSTHCLENCRALAVWALVLSTLIFMTTKAPPPGSLC